MLSISVAVFSNTKTIEDILQPMKQEPTTATVISLSLQEGLSPDGNQGPFIVMVIDCEPYIMLTVKKNIMAAKIVETLQNNFGVTKAMIGIAFDYRDSVQAGKLVLFPNPTCNGIYIPFNDLKGDVMQMLGR